MTKKWVLEQGLMLDDGGQGYYLIEDETRHLIAEIFRATPDELELMRKAPELLDACQEAVIELALYEKIARQDDDTDLLAVLDKLRKLLF